MLRVEHAAVDIIILPDEGEQVIETIPTTIL